MKKILLVDLCILGEKGGGHAEFYFMSILSMLTQEYDLVYACCANNELIKINIERDNIQKCQVVDIEVTLIDKILRRFLILLDVLLEKIPFKKYIKFRSLINLLIVKRILSNLDEEIPVFFHHTDSMMPTVPVAISKFFFPKQWIGLVILPSYQLKMTDGHEKSRLRFNAEKNFVLPSCKAILVLQPLYQHFYKKRFKHLNCLYLPELVKINYEIGHSINTNLLNDIRQQSQGKKIISLLGKITSRKNLPLFLESVSKLDLEKYFILVLGTIHIPNSFDDQKSIIIESNHKLIEFYKKQLAGSYYIDINYYIKNEAEFSALIQLTDIMYLHYQKYPFSSNILAKSMAHGKPVIVDKGFIMEKTLKKYNWKIAVEENSDKIAYAIDHLSNNDNKIDKNSVLSFLSNHSPEEFQKIVVKAISQFK